MSKEIKTEPISKEAIDRFLSNREDMLRTIFNSLQDAIFLVTSDRKLVKCNIAATTIFGYSQDELLNLSTITLHVDQAHYEEFGRRISDSFQHNEVAFFEFEAKRKSGEIFPTEHTVTQIKNDDGEMLGILSVVRDITNKKQVQENFQKSQRLLEETSKIGKVGGWEYDFIEEKLYWSPENYRIFGVSENTTPTYDLFFERVHPDDREKVTQHFEKSQRIGNFDIDFRLLINDQIKWVHGKANILIENKEPVRAFGFTQDITKSKLAEELLKENYEVLLETQEIGKIGTWELDLVKKKHSWSPENCRIFGCPNGTNPTYELFLNRVHPEDREKVMQHYEEAKKSGVYDIEYRLVIGGQIRWVHGKANFIRENNEAIRVIGFTQDITEKKTHQLAQLRSGQLSALGEVAAGVAHEINNPINGVINYAQLLLNKKEENDSSNQILERIIKEGNRISSIVQNLLNFAQKDRGELCSFDLMDIVVEPLNLKAQFLKKDGIYIDVGIPDNLPNIFGNKMQLEQVVLNLLSNARHALNKRFPEPSNEKFIVIDAQPSHSQNGECVQLRVRDSGCGIPKDHMQKIFNPFFTTKEAGVGTGLGMSVSLDILEKHGATISVDSQVNKYTEFTITFPLKSQ